MYLSFVLLRNTHLFFFFCRDEGGWDGWKLPIDFMSEPHKAAAQQFCSKKGNASMPNLPVRRRKRTSDGKYHLSPLCFFFNPISNSIFPIEISTTEPPKHGNGWKYKDTLVQIIQDDAKKNGINLTEQGKQYPGDAKERVKARFLKECPGAGMDISRNNWQNTLSVARGGVVVQERSNTSRAGAICATYKNTKFAITKGKDGNGFVKTFKDGVDGAKRCCEKFHKSAARVGLYVEALGLGFNKSEAYEVLDDVMPAEEAMKRALEICGQDEDLSKLESTDAATLVRELADYKFHEESMEDDADEEDKENCITIFQSQTCDIKCKLFMAAKCIQTDIAFTEKRIDKEWETDYTALIIPVSALGVCSIYLYIC